MRRYAVGCGNLVMPYQSNYNKHPATYSGCGGKRTHHAFIECMPPRTTHQSGNTILKTKDGRYFVGKNAKGKKVASELVFLFAVHKPSVPFTKPVQALIRWVYPWRGMDTRKNKEMGVLPCTTRPDCDNLAKGACDAMQKAGWFKDDAIIYDLRVQKLFGDVAGIEITMAELDLDKRGTLPFI